MIRLIRVTRDIMEGEKLEREDMEIVAIPKQYLIGLGDVVDESNLEFAIGQPLSQSLEKGRWLMWEHLVEKQPPLRHITQGNVAFALPVDPRQSPLAVIRPNDRVQIVGLLPFKMGAKAFVLMDGVRVLAVPRVRAGPSPAGAPAAEAPAPQTRPAAGRERPTRDACVLTIELEKEAGLELANVLSHVLGDVRVNLVSPRDVKTPEMGGNRHAKRTHVGRGIGA
jgi:Flp pilus assembly protein CpaB